MFGGFSSIDREPRTPGAELMIATVGRLASIALGLGLTFLAAAAISLLGPNLDDAGDAETAVSRLGPTATIALRARAGHSLRTWGKASAGSS